MNRESNSNHVCKWKIEEDELLEKLRDKQLIKSWKDIANRLSFEIQGSRKSGKQCRERYVNFLRFGSSKQQINHWTHEEDVLLFNKFMKFGPKWVQISRQMSSKSENNIKNRFHNAIGRMVRRIRKVEIINKLKNKKPIGQGILMKVLQQLGVFLAFYSQMRKLQSNDKQIFSFVPKFAERLIVFGTSKPEQISESEILQTVLDVHRFSFIYRIIVKTGFDFHIKKPFSDFVSDFDYFFKVVCQEIKSSLQKGIKKIEQNKEQSKHNSQKSQDPSAQRISQLSELSSFYSIFNQSQNLQKQLCQIIHEEYIPSCLPFYQ